MKLFTRRIAAVLLAVSLSLPSVALAASKGQDRDPFRDPLARAITKIKKILGVSTHSDEPSPPVPAPKP